MFIPEDQCESNQFACEYGGCLHEGQECDGYNDCREEEYNDDDKSDEKNCEHFYSTGESLVEISIKVIYLI